MSIKKKVFFVGHSKFFFRPEGSTKKYFGIFVFGRTAENEKENEKCSPNEKWPVFRPSLTSTNSDKLVTYAEMSNWNKSTKNTTLHI